VAGGGRRGPKAPPAEGGAHLKGCNEVEDPGARAAGLRPVEAGLQGRDAPRQPGAEAQRRRAGRAVSAGDGARAPALMRYLIVARQGRDARHAPLGGAQAE